jgi:peptide/nickel transport system substrate-binding protein
MFSSVRFFISLLTLAFYCSCTKPTKETAQILRYNEAEGITSLDPLQAHNRANIWAICQLFNGLVEPDSSLRIVPSLAERWDISEDGKTYRFYIRKHVRFHWDSSLGDSLELTAKDVEFSLKRVYENPSTIWVLNDIATDIHGSPSIYTINRYTLEIKLKQPYYQFLNRLAMPYCMIVSEKVIRTYGKESRRHPIGTGPFKFKAWRENEKMVFINNPDYFESTSENKIPKLDAINITFIKDRQIELLDFLNGDLDLLNGLDPTIADKLLNKDNSLFEKYTNSFRMIKSPYLNTEYLGIYLPDTMLTGLQLAVRKKINACIDRKKIIKYLRYGIGNPNVYSIVPETMSSIQLRMISDDPIKTKQINPNPITLFSTPGYTEISLQIRNDMERAGIRTEIEINDRSQHKNSVSNGKFGFFRASWIADYGDAESYLSLFYSKNQSPGGPNNTHFSNKRYDEFYEKSKVERDDEKRKEFYVEMETILKDELPVIVLYYDEMVRFEGRSLEGVRSSALNRLDFRKAEFK